MVYFPFFFIAIIRKIYSSVNVNVIPHSIMFSQLLRLDVSNDSKIKMIKLSSMIVFNM